MRYERKKEENSEVFYEVLDNSTKAAEFSYQQKFDETGQVCEQFWIRRIHLEQKCLDYRYLDAILQFIQYKCWCSGCRSMYVRLSARTLMDIERYKRYGFYVIAIGIHTCVCRVRGRTGKCVEISLYLWSERRRGFHSDLSGIFGNSWFADPDQ